MLSPLAQAVQSAADRPEVRAAIERVHRDLQEAIDQRQPICSASGRCCRFEQFGHRLYVTTLQLAAFRHALQPSASDKTTDWNGTGCPFQVGKLCGVHAIRPFGCRIFFCDPTAEQWQNEQYEQFHDRIKRLHEQLGVPYFYVEWREALAELGLIQQAANRR